jgi:stage V sporulation protein G
MAKKKVPEEDPLNGLKVTACQVYIVKEALGKTRALARVVLNDSFQLTGLRIIDGANGLFVSYPNDPTYKGEDYRSLFYPLTKPIRDHIELVVLEKFQEALTQTV